MEGVLRKPYLYAGAGVLVVLCWAFITGAGAILHGHPSYWFTYGTGLASGALAIVLAVVWSRRPTRIAWSIAGAIALVGVGLLLWWLRPFVATSDALEALQSDEHVEIQSSATEITMIPTADRSGVGLVFLPGAKVDARAYGHILRPLAEAGHMVVVVKEPLGVAFFATGAAPRWAAAHPDTETWVVAGHSLGGVVAAQNAAEPNDIGDLILWASFPADNVSSNAFAALSVFGTEDRLTTPDQIAASQSNLPSDTAFVAVEGAIHGHFGDYGAQPGDGDPAIARNEAQAQIVAATLEFLER